MKTYLMFIIALLGGRVYSQITPPSQASTGPGGSNYPYLSYDSSRYGTDITDMYWLFEPKNPQPDSVPVVIVFHGAIQQILDSTQAPSVHVELLKHLAKKGYIVIYPLYQYGGNTLPYSQQLTNTASVVNLALTELNNGNHVKPKRDLTGKMMIAVVGHSRGGRMSLDFANNYSSLGFPKFDAVANFMGSAQYGSLAVIPQSTKIIVVRAEHDAYTDVTLATLQASWDSLYHIPCSNKNYLQVNSDSLGNPALTADHYFFYSSSTQVSALDYFGSWKFSTALLNCTFYGTDCSYVFGTGNDITFMGNWSNGTPVTPVTVLDSCSTMAVEENQVSEIFEVNIFPNPSNGKFQVSGLSHNSAEQIENINIYNVVGEKVYEMDDVQGLMDNGDTLTINMGPHPNGIYFLQIKFSAFTQTKKLVR